MQDEVGFFDEGFNEGLVADIALVDFELVFDVGDIGGRSGREVIQDRYVVATGDQGICQVGADKTCTTGDKYAHEGSLRAQRGDRGDGLCEGAHYSIRKLSGW